MERKGGEGATGPSLLGTICSSSLGQRDVPLGDGCLWCWLGRGEGGMAALQLGDGQSLVWGNESLARSSFSLHTPSQAIHSHTHTAVFPPPPLPLFLKQNNLIIITSTTTTYYYYKLTRCREPLNTSTGPDIRFEFGYESLILHHHHHHLPLLLLLLPFDKTMSLNRIHTRDSYA